METDVEYAIVGGGIAGASVAYHLSRGSDAEVVVYERNEELGAETTHKSGAFFGDWGYESPTRLRLMRYSVELLNQFLSSPRTDLTYRSVSRLQVATSEEGAAAIREHHRAYQERIEEIGLPIAPSAYYDSDDLFRVLPLPRYNRDAVTGTLYAPNIGYVDPQALSTEFVSRAKEQGVRFEFGTAVDQLLRDGDEIVGLVADGERSIAEETVITAGPWTPKLLNSVGIHIPIRHTLGPIMVLNPKEDRSHSVQSFKHEETGVYARRNRNGTLLVGSYPGEFEDVTGQYDPGRSRSVPDEIKRVARDVIRRITPAYSEAPCVDEWVGIRSLTPDRDPLIGNVGLDRLSVVQFNASGIQLAATARDIIARQLVHDEYGSLDSAVSPTRFDNTPAG